MALTTCPDCEQRVSDAAPACPSCGRPHEEKLITARAATTQRSGKPQPWVRFFARMLDTALATVVLALITSVGEPSLFALNDLEPGIAFAALLLWVPVESLLIAWWGTTPGKALLGVSIRTYEGSRLPVLVAFNRSFRVWFFGWAAGLPLLSFAAPIVAYFRLRKAGVTPWDRKLDLRVLHEPVTAIRHAGIGAVLLLGVLALAAVRTLMETPEQSSSAASLTTQAPEPDVRNWPPIALPDFGKAVAVLKTSCSSHGFRYQLRVRSADEFMRHINSIHPNVSPLTIAFFDRDGFMVADTRIQGTDLMTAHEADGRIALVSNNNPASFIGAFVSCDKRALARSWRLTYPTKERRIAATRGEIKKRPASGSTDYQEFLDDAVNKDLYGPGSAYAREQWEEAESRQADMVKQLLGIQPRTEATSRQP